MSERESCDSFGEHPDAAVIISANGDHFCAFCNAEWWEDPL